MDKYWIAGGVFIVFTVIYGDSTIFKQISYKRQMNQLEKEIEYYTRLKEENQRKLEALRSDGESLEKLAREQYHMTKPDEELFIIRE